MKNKRTNEELRRLNGVEHITTVIRSSKLRWQWLRSVFRIGGGGGWGSDHGAKTFYVYLY